MSVVAERTILDAAHEVAAAVGDELVAAYAVGSAALGDFVPGESDLDVIAVVSRPLADEEKDAIAERARAVDVAPARGLELVIWARDREGFELNLNTGPGMVEHLSHGPENEPAHWFVLARSMSEQHAVPLVGPPWTEVFPPVPRAGVLASLASSLAWHERHEPGSANAVRNACRALVWLESGSWVSKPAAATWLAQRACEAVERAR